MKEQKEEDVLKAGNHHENPETKRNPIKRIKMIVIKIIAAKHFKETIVLKDPNLSF